MRQEVCYKELLQCTDGTYDAPAAKYLTAETGLDTHDIKSLITPYCTLGPADELVRAPPHPPPPPLHSEPNAGCFISLWLLIGSHSNRQQSNGPIRCSSEGRELISTGTAKLRDNDHEDSASYCTAEIFNEEESFPFQLDQK
jgi:hypothetical protein